METPALQLSHAQADVDTLPQPIAAAASEVKAPAVAKTPERILVRLVRTEDLLDLAIDVRRQTYARHAPEMEQLLERPERLDFSPEAVVLIAEDDETGQVLGSMRIMTNVNHPLDFEAEIQLPAMFSGHALSLVQRLSIVSGPQGLLAKKTLFKAYFLYSLAMQVEWMFLYTPPPRDRLFTRIGFKPALAGNPMVSGRFSDGRLVRLLALRTWDVESLWRNSLPDWHQFFFAQHSPGIQVFSSVSNWTKRSRDTSTRFKGH